MTANEDGADFGNDSSGTWTSDVFDHNTDDGIDLNGRVQISLRNSTVEANEGDGIEFRLYPYTGPRLDVDIVGNRFVRNDSDGIQLIDSDDASSRVVRIERNVFDHNGAAAIGCLPNQQTNEDFSGAPLAERVHVTNNTFNGDRYGISGGANSIVLNNIFTGIPVRALHRVGGGSIAAYNLFWNNATNYAESVVDEQTSVFADPMLTTDLALQPGSPAIDAGTATYQWNGEPVLDVPAGSYAGAAPDLGAFELGSSGGTPNQAPIVDAGPDQTVTLPAGATLDATVTDDGRPSGALTATWTQTSGPGTTTFADATAVDTNATFSQAGTYGLRLVVGDGELTGSDTLQVVVQPAPPAGSGSVDRRIAVSSDDAEESATGSYSGSSSDLELVFDGSNQQVGLRFPNITVPKSATITRAYVQFEADEAQSESTALTIRGQAADNPATFSSANKISTRPRTAAAATWSPAAWAVTSEAGPNQRTTDLSAVVQELVNRPGWASGNALALLVTGTGHRTARAYDGKPAGAPLLHVEFTSGGTGPAPNQAPVVNAGADQTITLPASAALDGTVTDDGLPSGTLTTTWTRTSGPGTVVFGNPGAVDTTATFAEPGTYTLQLAAGDGELSASDTIQVVVRSAPAPGAAVTLMGAGDIASSGSSLVNAQATGDLIREGAPDAAFTLGDNAYTSGTLAEYQTAYDSTWGSFRSITHPVPGNHDYEPPPPDGYVAYFGAANVTNPVDGGLYYAWDVGNGWRAYAVNGEIDTSGAQLTWLRNDVAAHPGMHYILYTHHPRFSSGSPSSYATNDVCPLWDALAATGGLEIVMAGHMHNYERFARMDCAGTTTDAGARSFVVGSGGNQLYPFGTTQPGSQARNGTDYGVLRLVLQDSSYAWSFIASGRGWDGSTSVDTHNKWQVLDSGTQATRGAPAPGNTAPSVNAGPDQTITLPATAALDGTVSDDGLPNPPATVTTGWSKASGPGTVTFADPAAVDTTATFSVAGSYVLQLSAGDSAATNADTVAVTVQPAPGGGGTTTAEVRVPSGANDVEQAVAGSVSLTSSDLELTTDGTTQQVVGTRFPGLTVPKGATVTRAYVQFQVDEVSTDASSMTIRAENSDNAALYTSASGSVTARAVTGSVPWAAPSWPTVGAAGADQRTPDVSALVQAVVNRAGWTSGNALALQFSGTGRRTAEAFEGSATGAPLLHVEYTTGGGGTPTNTAPVVDAGPDQTITLPATAALDGTVSDDGLPAGTLTTTWTQVSGPGTATFGAAGSVDTSATFSTAGTYVLRLTADDGQLNASDTVQVVVQPAPPPGPGPSSDASRRAATTPRSRPPEATAGPARTWSWSTTATTSWSACASRAWPSRGARRSRAPTCSSSPTRSRARRRH